MSYGIQPQNAVTTIHNIPQDPFLLIFQSLVLLDV
jgi:hypothetical protein